MMMVNMGFGVEFWQRAVVHLDNTVTALSEINTVSNQIFSALTKHAVLRFFQILRKLVKEGWRSLHCEYVVSLDGESAR